MTREEDLRASFEALDRRAAENRGESLRDKIRTHVGIWRHNRQLYPGWIVAPWTNRLELYQSTKGWIAPIIAEVSEVSAHEQISWLRELVWRLDVCLSAIDENLANAADAALIASGFTNENATPPERSLANQVDLEDCIALSVSLLRCHRELNDSDAFEHLEARLLATATITPNVRSHVFYERILMHLSRLEYADAAASLASWPLPMGGPIWAVRRAALNIEMGNSDGARLVGEALTTVQEALPRGPVHEASDFHLLSCEGWALANVLNVRGLAATRAAGGRLEDLAAIQCDPFRTLARMRSVVTTGGSDRPSRSYLRDEPSEVEYALQAIRLIEVGGRIVRLGNELVAASLLKEAASRIVNRSPLRCILLSLRLGDDGELSKVLRAKTVSRLSVNQIASLKAIFRKALREAMPRVSQAQEQAAFGTSEAVRNQRAQDQAEAALAGLGSLSPRLIADDLDEIIRELCVQRRTWRGGVWQVRIKLDEVTSTLLKALSIERRAGHALDLLDQPLVGMISNMAKALSWQNDPFGLLIGAPRRDRTPDTDRWQRVVAKLIYDTETTEDPDTRADGLMRCAVLHRMDMLTTQERDKLTAAIWSPGGLAARFTLPSAYFFALPEIEGGQAEQSIRIDVASRSLPRFALDVGGKRRWSMNQAKPYDVVVNILRVTRTPFDQPESFRLGTIEWQSGEVAATLSKIQAWWQTEGRELCLHLKADPSPWGEPTWRFTSIVEAITYLALPHCDLASQATGLLMELADAGVEIEFALPLFLLADPSRTNEIADVLRRALVDNDAANVNAAMCAAYIWFRNEPGTLPAMPFDLPSEIGAAVCHRRQPALGTVLHVATLLMASQTSPSFRKDIEIGLHHLRLETSSAAKSREASSMDLSAERGVAIKLLAAYARTQHASDAVVSAWLEAAEDEPFEHHRTDLVDIRNFWLARSNEGISTPT